MSFHGWCSQLRRLAPMVRIDGAAYDAWNAGVSAATFAAVRR